MTGLRVGVVGSTGVIGKMLLRCLREASDRGEINISSVQLFAQQGAGRFQNWGRQRIEVQALADTEFANIDCLFLCVSALVAKQVAARAVDAGCIVIDSSSAYRMHDNVPLIIPEINAGDIKKFKKPKLFANPNCSTIQLLVALQPLHATAGITSITVSTYQSASGAGKHLMQQLQDWSEGEEAFDCPIAGDVYAQIDSWDQGGYTREEMKVREETRKIWSLESLAISTTAVRVPVMVGHAESVAITLASPQTPEQVAACWSDVPSCEYLPAPEVPTPRRHAEGKDVVTIGRLRQDLDDPCRYHLWVVADNLRRGGALNAVQIAKLLSEGNYFSNVNNKVGSVTG